MLNENLARVRKERGLTQEALAVKLNVVRQTISKWEKGTAVPDADTLCKVADELEVPVSELLGNSLQGEKSDATTIATSLAQINEQLAIRNRRTATIWKAACIAVLVLAALAVGIFCFVGREDKLRIPENVEVSNVTFSTKNGNLICIFVPSVGSSDIDYEVTYYSLNGSFPSETVTAKYESGICTATIEESRMKKQMSYGVILNIRYKNETRTVSLSEYFVYNNISKWGIRRE